MRILGFVVLIVAVAVSLWNRALVNIPSLLIVIGLTLASMLAAYGRDFWLAFRAVFSATADCGSLQQAIAMWRRTRSMAIISGGILGTFIGLVLILQETEDVSQIGQSLGVAFLPTVYSLILAFGVIQPVLCSLQQKLEDAGQ